MHACILCMHDMHNMHAYMHSPGGLRPPDPPPRIFICIICMHTCLSSPGGLRPPDPPPRIFLASKSNFWGPFGRQNRETRPPAIVFYFFPVVRNMEAAPSDGRWIMIEHHLVTQCFLALNSITHSPVPLTRTWIFSVSQFIANQC